MMVKVFRSNYEGYTTDLAATESPKSGYTLKDAEMGTFQVPLKPLVSLNNCSLLLQLIIFSSFGKKESG